MKKLYIIGNGFDLHHGLPTSYADYKKFLQNKNPDFIARFDDFLDRYVEPNENISMDNIAKWSDLESYTRYIYDFDLNEILEEAINSSEKDRERAAYWHDIQAMCENYSAWINGIRLSVSDWINTVDYSEKVQDLNLQIDKTAAYLNFNYTKTLEEIYEIPHEKVLHIHGSIGGELIFGNDKMPQKTISDSSLLQDYTEDADWRVNEAASILNSALEKSIQYYKDTTARIKENKEFFEQCQECQEFIFMGYGFGREDMNYMQELLSQANLLQKVIFYYHEPKDYEKFEKIFKVKLKDKVEVENVEW